MAPQTKIFNVKLAQVRRFLIAGPYCIARRIHYEGGPELLIGERRTETAERVEMYQTGYNNSWESLAKPLTCRII